jgi:hypothetical protein
MAATQHALWQEHWQVRRAAHNMLTHNLLSNRAPGVSILRVFIVSAAAMGIQRAQVQTLILQRLLAGVTARCH